ncbi:MAG: response regulator, partial [Bacteroidota bacterium]
FIINDNGPGIPEKDLSKVFDKFYQIENIKGGTGIGLALVKEIVELWNGKIKLLSKEWHGTTFEIQLPITNNADFGEVQVIENHIPAYANAKHEIEDDQAEILIVEDNDDVKIYLRELLHRQYNLHFAPNGKIGFDAAKRIVPDIIISDVMMPEMDGFNLTKQLKNEFITDHIPIILLTAKTAEKDRLRGIEVGADAFLNKPFNREELFLRINQLYESRQRLIQKYKVQSKEPIDINTKASVKTTFLEKLEGYVSQNLAQANFGIDNLCQEFKINQNQLYRKIKATTDLAPTIYIRHMRLNKAIQLLKSSDYNISEIAYKVGFNDPNYFTRVFTQTFNQSPSDFVKN